MLGVGHKTVKKYRRELEDGWEFPNQLEGADGVKQPAEKSNNSIAKMLGVDHKTVIKYRKEIGSQIANPDKREGTDGKKYSAEKETEADSKNVRSS